MRKITALLLLICMAFSVFAACEKPNEDVSEDSSGDTVSEAAVQSPRVELMDSVLSDVDRSKPSSNLLEGKKYSLSREASTEYPDAGGVLTDGLDPIGFIHEIWVGFTGTAPLEVTVDLGAEYVGLSDFSACVLNYPAYGIGVPGNMKVYASRDKGDPVELGTVYPPTGMGTESYRMTLNLQGQITARYITFSFSSMSSPWLFLGEISAFAYGDQYKKATISYDGKEYYGYTGLPEAEGELWDKSAPDYGKTVNLTPVNAYIYAHEDIDGEFATDWYNPKVTKLLYDNRTSASVEINNGAWLRMTKAGGRDIIYDLGKVSAVSEFKLNFLKHLAAGVSAPLNLSVSVSVDGESWQTVFSKHMVESAGNETIITVDEQFDAVKAQFVRFYFNIDSHVYIDEITVMGNKDVTGVPDPDPAHSLMAEDIGYIMPEDFDGVSNIFLAYNGMPSGKKTHDEAGLITVDEFLPHVAYLDKEGNIQDTFFDAYLFLPYAAMNADNFLQSADGWHFYVDDTFYADRNMNALEECVGNVKDVLDLADYKVKVYTTVMRPWGEYEYGDIDGDGVDEDFSKLEERQKAVKWLMDEELRRFNEGNYQNLEFHGFYWYEEEIYYNDPLDAEVAKYAVAYAHSLGVKMIWIPFNGGKGVSDWKSFGFDLVSQQPNYMFGRTFDNGFLYITAEKAAKYGMCIEMEMGDNMSYNDIWRFYEYMRVGAETGYMDAVKAYYQGGVPGPIYKACYSETPSVRQIYDDIYKYSRCEYTAKSDEELSITIDSEISSTKNRTLRIECDALYKEFIVLAVAPKYGSVKINRDGTLIYTPTKDFVGTDSFALQVQLGYDEGPLYNVDIVIE